MTTFDATEAAYKNGYAAGIKERLEYIDFLQKRCEELKKERDALLSDVSGYQGVICNYCANLVRVKGAEPTCKRFGEFPISDGAPLMCGRWEWRGLSLDVVTSDKKEEEK